MGKVQQWPSSTRNRSSSSVAMYGITWATAAATIGCCDEGEEEVEVEDPVPPAVVLEKAAEDDETPLEEEEEEEPVAWG